MRERTVVFVAAVEALAIAVLALLWLQKAPAPSPEPIVPEHSGEVTPPVTTALRAPDPTETPHASANAGSRPTDSRPESASNLAVLFGAVRFATPSARPTGSLRLMRGAEQIEFVSLERGPTFAFAGLVAGSYTLKGQAPDCLPIERIIEVSAPRTRFDVTFEKAWIVVVHVVTQDTRPLLEALPESAQSLRYRGLGAIATRTRPAGDLPPTSLSRIDGGVGSFRDTMGFDPDRKPLAKTAIGALVLPRAEGPLFVVLLVRNAVVAVQQLGLDQSEVTFTLARDDLLARLASVRLRVVDGLTGVPVTKVRVALDDDQSGSAGQLVDEAGRITLVHQRPGLLNLGLRSETALLSGPPVRVDVRPGAQIDLGDIAILPREKVAFAIEGGKEESLTLTWLETPPPGCLVRPSRGGGREGDAELSLYPGRYSVVARSKDAVAETTIDTRQLAGQKVKLRLATAPRFTVRNQVGEGFVDLTLRGADGRAVWNRVLSGSWEQSWAMSAGDYVAELTDLEGKITRKNVRLGTGGATLIVP